jgi:hypothetical protein
MMRRFGRGDIWMEPYLYGAFQVPEVVALGVQGIQVDHDGI